MIGSILHVIASHELVNVYHDGVPLEDLNEKYKISDEPSYIQEYLPGLKPTSVSKRDIMSWSSNALSYRERGQLGRDRETIDSTDSNLVSELLLKVKLGIEGSIKHPFFADNYLTLVIKRTGHVYIKFLENKGDIPFDMLYCIHLDSVIPVINELNKFTRDKIPLFLPERPKCRVAPTNMEYTTFDANIKSITTEKPITFKKLADNLQNLVTNFFDFRVIRDTDEIKMRYKSVDNFQSFSNIRNHF